MASPQSGGEARIEAVLTLQHSNKGAQAAAVAAALQAQQTLWGALPEVLQAAVANGEWQIEQHPAAADRRVGAQLLNQLVGAAIGEGVIGDHQQTLHRAV